MKSDAPEKVCRKCKKQNHKCCNDILLGESVSHLHCNESRCGADNCEPLPQQAERETLQERILKYIFSTEKASAQK